MTDKRGPQLEVAQRLCTLMHEFPDSARGVLFVRAFFSTMVRDWISIDKHRIDKYYTLIRGVVRQIIGVCAGAEWSEQVAAPWLDMLQEAVMQRAPNGPRFHVLYIWTAELALVHPHITTEQCVVALRPLWRALLADAHPRLNDIAVRNGVAALMKRIFEAQEDSEDEDGDVAPGSAAPTEGPFRHVDPAVMGKLLFEIAADQRTGDELREFLYSAAEDMRSLGAESSIGEGELGHDTAVLMAIAGVVPPPAPPTTPAVPAKLSNKQRKKLKRAAAVAATAAAAEVDDAHKPSKAASSKAAGKAVGKPKKQQAPAADASSTPEAAAAADSIAAAAAAFNGAAKAKSKAKAKAKGKKRSRAEAEGAEEEASGGAGGAGSSAAASRRVTIALTENKTLTHEASVKRLRRSAGRGSGNDSGEPGTPPLKPALKARGSQSERKPAKKVGMASWADAAASVEDTVGNWDVGSDFKSPKSPGNASKGKKKGGKGGNKRRRSLT